MSAIALLAGTALALSACGSSSAKHGTPTAVVTQSDGQTTTSTVPSTSPTPSEKPKPPAVPVHVKLLNSDNSTPGVGMPIIAFFSRRITSAKAFSAATKVTVNGVPVKGAWYFETSAAHRGYPIEGHYRTRNYWPAHAAIHLALPVKGLPAGGNMDFDDSLTLDFSTGAANISTVDDSTHLMTVQSDGKTYGTFPVSLGASDTPTLSGSKVIMEKGRDISMTGPGYFDAHVKNTQRLTYGGEYLHSAPWNTPANGGNIGRADSSNGCTNLLPADAEKLYGFLSVGDVVRYPNASGPRMQLGQGYGDWNVLWSQWQTGGLVHTQ